MSPRSTAVALYYALADLKNGRGRMRAYRDLLRAQWASPEEIAARREERVRRILSHAVARVPYYRALAAASGADPRDGLSAFPVLDRRTVRERFDDLCAPGPAPGRYVNRSGGSTGEPVRVLQDAAYADWDWAVTALMYGWAGRRFGEPLVKLWGDAREIGGGAGDRVAARIERLERIRLLDSFTMSDERMRAYAGEINRIRPVLVEAYAQSAAALARFLSRKRIAIHSPRGVISTAGVLLSGEREAIESAFGCRVFNRYGSREIGNIACECAAHAGLHVDALGKHVEILNERGEACAPGETGRVVVTPLANFAMPLIRYEIGDLAAWGAGPCPCGRGFPLLERVSGRIVDVFRNAAGARVDGEYFTHLFYGLEFVEAFQVIQRAIDLVEIRVAVSDRRAWEEAFPRIRERVREAMGAGCRVAGTVTDRIEPSKSGKRRFTICELGNEGKNA